jgi:hypothetical protein
MNLRTSTLLTLSVLAMTACGKTEPPPAKSDSAKLTPEQCYEETYAKFSAERQKELEDSGQKGPFAEQELVPQGMRAMIEEDCADGIYGN